MSQISNLCEIEQIVATETLSVFPIVSIFVTAIELGVVVRSAIGVFILEDRC